MSARLDIEQPDRLLEYLRSRGHLGEQETVAMRPLPGGVSSRVVFVERGSGETWVIKQALEKLRVAVEWRSNPARSHSEAMGLRLLASLAPPATIPKLLFDDAEHCLLGMEAVPSPHENWKLMLLAGRLRRSHVEQAARLLAAVHRNAWIRRDELAGTLSNRTHFESLRLEPYYLYTASQVPTAGTFLRNLVDDTRARALTLVHGDFSPKNLLITETRCVLVDHEVVHWGDPAFDAGFFLTHLLSKAHHLPVHRKAFLEAARVFWRTYSEAAGDNPWVSGMESTVIRHLLACLLARVAGRSPLEYFSAAEQQRQREIVLSLLPAPPRKLSDFLPAFHACLSSKG